ncbi:leucine aminopeptidase 3 [Phyllostomus discolor]|uniref:Cytosol aminopeptidase n=1 Tax=Phyllostomus discolor TaxID=89673 RepID=A0A6J2L9R3_9CHIR|nr:cytosol aminopeptidase [Phyllostomus discolor]XP_035875056.1 cytosol aminopeptidase [Phyllostomus discolor]KAF6130671.1 leucine aminopeptidase 3 [Phyllostomus discolor]
MFLLPLPAAGLFAIRRLGVKRFWSRGSFAADMTKGLVLGIYSREKEDDMPQFTSAGENFDKLVSGKLREVLNISGPPLKAGKTRTFYGLHEDFPSVVVVGLGRKGAGVDDLENWHEGKENIRVAVAVGCRQIQDLEIASVEVDPCGDAQAAAEGAVLGLYEYDKLKQKKKAAVSAKLYGSGDQEAWQRGVLFASGQNLARQLMETPANEMTPTKFAEEIEKNLKSASSKTEVHIRPKSWIEEQEMGSFLSVAKGSDEPPVFLEIHYRGSPDASDAPLVFVGKGITFDSGGISIKPSANMDLMRADMGGAATICSAIVTAAKLGLPLNIVGLAPLCENMPSGKANKPGDVVRAKNGKTIQVDNTDAEGRLILADALFYAHTFNPKVIIDAATLTGAMDVALGSGATGVFTNSSWLWNRLSEASVDTGDRVWRMPLFEHYTRQVVDCQLADVNNIGKYRSAGACTAAAFLREFVTHPKWAHLDIAGVMTSKDDVSCLRKGMSGRPTRTLIEFLVRFGQDSE